MVAGRLCYMSVYAAMFADSNDVPILLMIMFYIIHYFIYMVPLLDPIIKSTAGYRCNDHQVYGGAHQWGPTDMIPGLLNVYVYIYVCETCITVCRMFLNMYAYINIYIRWYNDMMICIYLSNRIESNQIKSNLITSHLSTHYITLYTLHYILHITLHYIHYIIYITLH